MKRISLIVFIVFVWINLYSQAKKQNPQLDKIDILHYDFDLKISDQSDIIEVTSVITVKFLKDTKSFYLDLETKEGDKGMTVSSVLQGSNNLVFEHKKDKLTFSGEWQKGTTIMFSIKYAGIPSDGLVISKNKLGKRTFFGDNWIKVFLFS